MGKLFFFHKNIHSCDRKKIFVWKQNLKKRKKLGEFFQRQESMTKRKTVLIWMREIRKISIALKLLWPIKEKLDWLFVSLQYEKRSRVNSTEARSRASVEWGPTGLISSSKFVIQWLAQQKPLTTDCVHRVSLTQHIWSEMRKSHPDEEFTLWLDQPSTLSSLCSHR